MLPPEISSSVCLIPEFSKIKFRDEVVEEIMSFDDKFETTFAGSTSAAPSEKSGITDQCEKTGSSGSSRNSKAHGSVRGSDSGKNTSSDGSHASYRSCVQKQANTFLGSAMKSHFKKVTVFSLDLKL